ncbi:hypothetical protein Plim_1007 [Planctopirus limnophila DSM 3776]|uniref:Uncharacterized protein n=1 Tax=Planctopirus limnophila (strain ATCC 43296 / DSM 3776 / IFAM 1008 / Mu 290) TaxID=521674 RepID=D5ST82_PLAL2|nr:hypothetical protein Plim_1007 [Planctopirus limnophila DSM 3776]
MEMADGTHGAGIVVIVGLVKWLSWLEDPRSTAGKPAVAHRVHRHVVVLEQDNPATKWPNHHSNS